MLIFCIQLVSHEILLYSHSFLCKLSHLDVIVSFNKLGMSNIIHISLQWYELWWIIDDACRSVWRIILSIKLMHGFMAYCGIVMWCGIFVTKNINYKITTCIGRIFVGYGYREGVEPQGLLGFCYQIRKIKINVHENKRELKYEKEFRVLTSPLSAQQWLIRFNPRNSFYACYN